MDKINENNVEKNNTDKSLVPNAYEISSAFAEFIAKADKQAEPEKNDSRK